MNHHFSDDVKKTLYSVGKKWGVDAEEEELDQYAGRGDFKKIFKRINMYDRSY